MEEGGYATNSKRIGLEIASAIHAVNLARDMLKTAKERCLIKDYHSALEYSRNSIRIASSAVLIRDGYITDDFEKTVKYLTTRYDSRFPLREWEKVEMTYLGEGGLYNIILKAMGKTKKSDDELVLEAISVAEKFVRSVRNELSL